MSRWRLSAVVLLALYCLAGIFGRFPWKADEPYAFGVIWGMLQNHEWLIPTVANQPFVEKPPLVYWLGATFARLAPFAAPYEGSRVAILLLVSVTAASLYASARSLHAEVDRWRLHSATTGAATQPGIDAPTYGLLALLVMAGTFGFAEHIHKLTPDLGQLAGATFALQGLVDIASRVTPEHATETLRRSRGGFLLGSGAGIAFLSKGLFVPGVLALAIPCCLLIPAYRRPSAVAAFGIAVIVALPWFILWPAWLHHASPALFDEWLWDNNVGRFMGYVALGGNNVSLATRAASISIMGFPPLLLAASAAARACSTPGAWGSNVRDAPGHAAVAIYLVISLLALAVSASMRDIYVLPALPAMILLGVPSFLAAGHNPRSSIERVIDLAFAGLAVIVLIVWLCLTVRGDLSLLPPLQQLATRWLPLPFHLPTSALALTLAGTALIAWRQSSRHAPVQSATLAFCSGVAMLWVVTSALLLPWIDAARSYRAMLLDVKTELATRDGCVTTVNLGESEVALLDYVTRARIARVFLGHSGTGDPKRPNPAANRCPWMLVLSNRSSGPITPRGDRWIAVWSGSRPADHNETFVLYRARQAQE